MKRLTKREKCGLCILAFVVLIYSYVDFFFTPINNKTKLLNQSIIEYNKMVNLKANIEYCSANKNDDKYNTVETAQAQTQTQSQTQTQTQVQTVQTAQAQMQAQTQAQTMQTAQTQTVKTTQPYKTTQTTKTVHEKQNHEILEEELPNMEKNSEIAYNIMVTAEKAKVRLNTIEIGEAATFKSSPPIKFVPIVLEFTGPLNNLIELLKELEEQNRICEINDVSISIGPESWGSVGSGSSGNSGGYKNATNTNTKLKVSIRYFFTGVD
jgi:hypothetical protein